MPSIACRVCMNTSPEGTSFCAHCGSPLGGSPISIPRVPALSTPAQPRPAVVDPFLGRTVAGRFQVLELIGTGGMGRVYKAKHLGLDKIVCLKTLRPSLAEDPTLVGRFEREAKAASRLDHPNSIQVLDFGQDETGTLFLVMEFVQGRDLRKLLKEEFPLGEARICHIAAQMLAAVGRAHTMGVIHRDLKPENVLVSRRDDAPDFVKVLDFGIAKLQDANIPGLTRADMICGTPEYVSPEQARGAPYDARSDLYAVGVILYQLVTGELPFRGDTPLEILQKHVNDAPVPPRTKRPGIDVSFEFEGLILRALSKNPADRPQTAELFRSELLAIAQRASSAGVPAETADQLSIPKPRRQDVTADLPPDEHFPKEKSSSAPLFIGLAVAALALGGAFYAFEAEPAEPPMPEPSRLIESTNNLTLDGAYKVIESHYPDVRKCFEAQSKRLTGGGKVVLTIAIGSEGAVSEAAISETTFAIPKLDQCIVGLAKKWAFAKPKDGALFVSYPYIFRKK